MIRNKLLRILFLSLSLFALAADLRAKNSSEQKAFITHVTLTTYNAVKEQCDNDPLTTADGTKIDKRKLKHGKIRYVAISRDLLWAIPLGSIVEIEGHGIYEVRDTMNSRFNHCMDILQHESNKNNFKKEKIKVTVKRKGKANG